MSVAPISELLLGVVALQKGYLTLPQMLSAVAERGAQSLADTLVSRGLLDAARLREVERDVSAALDASGGDPHITLQNLQTDQRMLLESLSAVGLDDGHTLRSTPSAPPHLGLAPVFAETPGRYEWEQTHELGRGGVGRVVSVWDSSMGRDVAIKQLLMPVESPKARHALEARFLREARLTGQLEHPAVLPVYEVGRQDDGGLFYAMQRVRGRTLHDAIHATPDLRQRLALMPHFLTTCQALAYAHSRGVIHRDVKPQNIMIGQYGETYLLDWGLARVRGHTDLQARERAMLPDLTGNVLEGRAIGTPAYMSPEQADGRFADIDEKSDVWGLGAVLFELIARQPPHSASNPVSMIMQVREDDVVPLQQLQPEAPPELCAIAKKCLSRDRATRYPNASAVAADVEAWLTGRRVSAHRYGALELLSRFVRQNRLATAVASVAIVALAAAGAVALQRIQHERDSAKELAQLFLDDVSLKLEPNSGSRALLEELTTQTLQRYEAQLDPLSGQHDDRLKLGWAWQRIGRLTYKVGKTDDSAHAFEYARRVADALLSEAPADASALTLASEARIGTSDVAQDRGDLTLCETTLRDAVRFSEAAVKAQPELLQGLDSESRAWSRLADLLNSVGRNEESLSALQRSRQIDGHLLALKPDDAKALESFGVGAIQLAQIYFARGDLPKARVAYQEALDTGKKGMDQFHGDPDLTSVYAYGASETASIDRILGQPVSDEIAAAQGLMEQVLTSDPDNLEFLSQTIELTVERQDMPSSWRWSRHLIELDASGEYLTSALVGAFITGHHREVLQVGLVAKGLARFAGALFGALSAAALGDWATAATLAARARDEISKKSTLSWSWRRMELGLTGLDGPGPDAVRKLCPVIDAFYVTAKDRPMLEALAEFQTFAEAQARGH